MVTWAQLRWVVAGGQAEAYPTVRLKACATGRNADVVETQRV